MIELAFRARTVVERSKREETVNGQSQFQVGRSVGARGSRYNSSVGSSTPPSKFQPKDCTKVQPHIELPDEPRITILESPCTFPPEIFVEVMLNLIKNPNITSSHLFRADIFYDSERDYMTPGGLLKHLKKEYQPLEYVLPDFDKIRTIVRQLIPRNAQLDRPLVQRNATLR